MPPDRLHDLGFLLPNLTSPLPLGRLREGLGLPPEGLVDALRERAYGPAALRLRFQLVSFQDIASSLTRLDRFVLVRFVFDTVL